MNRLYSFAPVALATLALMGCNGGPNKTNIEIIQNMMDQPSIKSQDWVPEDGEKGQMRMPPAHSVPQGFERYKYAGDPLAAEKNSPPCEASSPETLKLGKTKYDTYCSMCHGVAGGGDGLVSKVMLVKPRNLLSADARSYSPGRILYAITEGRGVMRSYASQIPNPADRCAIMYHVKELQK